MRHAYGVLSLPVAHQSESSLHAQEAVVTRGEITDCVIETCDALADYRIPTPFDNVRGPAICDYHAGQLVRHLTNKRLNEICHGNGRPPDQE